MKIIGLIGIARPDRSARPEQDSARSPKHQPEPEPGARKIGLARSGSGPPDPNAHPWSKQYKPDGLPNFKLRDLEKVKTVTNLGDIKYEKNLHHFVFFVRNIIKNVSRADYLYRLFALKFWACYSLIFAMKSIRDERRRNFGQDRQLIS